MRADARVVLWTGVSIASTSLMGFRPAVIGMVLLAAFCALTGISWRAIAVRAGPLAFAMLLLAVAAPLAPERSLELAVRGLLLSSTAALVAVVVPWTTAVGALQTLHAPRILVAFIALVARQTVSLSHEVARVRRALLVRGAFDARGGRLRSARVLLIALVPTVLRRADHLADALALRGFEGRIPVPRPWRPHVRELPLFAVALVAALAALWEKLPWIRSAFASAA